MGLGFRSDYPRRHHGEILSRDALQELRHALTSFLSDDYKVDIATLIQAHRPLDPPLLRRDRFPARGLAGFAGSALCAGEGFGGHRVL